MIYFPRPWKGSLRSVFRAHRRYALRSYLARSTPTNFLVSFFSFFLRTKQYMHDCANDRQVTVVEREPDPPTRPMGNRSRDGFNDFALLSGAYESITYVRVSILVVI